MADNALQSLMHHSTLGCQHRPLLSAFLFSSLLMLKHIYLYLAPAYFVFLLRTYVMPARTTSDKPSESGPASRLFTLGTITLMPPLIAVMPLLASGLTTSAPAGPFGILKQMLARLFPFQRGLNHAYWAANFWALYSFMDRALLASGVLSSSTAAEEARISSSRGLVGDTAFGVLPDISASHCFILTAAPLLVLCSRLWTRPTYLNFLTVLVSSGLTSFIFGYHVHEKAVLLPLLPLTLLAPINYHYARLTLLLSMAGILAIFPLLYGAKETPLKVLYTTVWGFLVFGSIRRQVYRPVPSNFMAVAHVLENTYLMGFIGVQLYVSVLHSAFFTRERSPSVKERQQLLAGATDAGAAVVDFVTSALLANGSPGLMSSSSKDTLAPNSTANAMRSMSVPASETSYRDASSKPSQSAAGLGATVETHTLYEFLPLMLISVYSALGILWVWARLGWILLTQSSSTHRMSNTMTAPARGQHVPPDGKAMQ